MTKGEAGRLFFRQEGTLWNAYWAELQTSMDGAVLIGSVRLDLVKRSPDAKEAFMQAMRAAFSALAEDVIGASPEWGRPRAAPESERGGNA